MTDPVSAQTPAEPINSQADASNQEPAAQEPIKALDEARVRSIAEEIATRTAQSLVDKSAARLSRQAQDQIAALQINKETLGLNDEQVTAAKQRIVMHDLTTPAAAGTQISNPPPSNEAPLHPIIAETFDIFKEEGIAIQESDPEYKIIADALQDPQGSPSKYRKVLYKQIEAKRQRQASINETATVRSPGGGGNTTPGSAPAASAHDLWENAYKK